MEYIYMGLLTNWTNLTMGQRVLLVLALVTCFIVAIVYYYADKSAKAKAKVAKAKAKVAAALAQVAADAQATADAAQVAADAQALVNQPTCAGFNCTGGYTIKSPLPTGDCVVDPCTRDECCDTPVTDAATGGAQVVVPSCTLPVPAPTGYVYGNNKAVTGTGPDTTDITCDATNGWHSDGSIVASCDATTFYSLSGCTQGCAKPVAEVLGYNLTAAAPVVPVVPIGNGNLSGASCAAEYTGDIITYGCVAAAAATETQYYSVQGCTLTTDPSCTLPEPAPTGYVYGANKAVTDTGPDTTDITCDADKGWYASDAASSIVASCDATTSLYSLDGCTQGCAKPVAGAVPPGYDLTLAPAFLDYGTDSRDISGSCSGSGTGPVLGTCIDDVTEAIDYYTVEGCPPPVVSAQLPPTCSAPPQGQTGYIITDVNIGRPTGIVVDGVTCDASNGWFATGDIYANCPSQGHSRFGGCEQGCSKPNYDMPWLDLTHAPATLQIGAQGTQGVTCTYSGTPSVQCLTAGQDYFINNCSHQPPVVSTQLPACVDIMVSGHVPSIAGVRVDGTGIRETECINHCSSQATCKSISYDSTHSYCYTYNAEYATPALLVRDNYNYYPEKCQP
jgi:hypothetical protein